MRPQVHKEEDGAPALPSYNVQDLADRYRLPLLAALAGLHTPSLALAGAGGGTGAAAPAPRAGELLGSLPPLLRLRAGLLLAGQLFQQATLRVQPWLCAQAVQLEMQVRSCCSRGRARSR